MTPPEHPALSLSGFQGPCISLTPRPNLLVVGGQRYWFEVIGGSRKFGIWARNPFQGNAIGGGASQTVLNGIPQPGLSALYRGLAPCRSLAARRLNRPRWLWPAAHSSSLASAGRVYFARNYRVSELNRSPAKNGWRNKPHAFVPNSNSRLVFRSCLLVALVCCAD